MFPYDVFKTVQIIKVIQKSLRNISMTEFRIPDTQRDCTKLFSYFSEI